MYVYFLFVICITQLSNAYQNREQRGYIEINKTKINNPETVNQTYTCIFSTTLPSRILLQYRHLNPAPVARTSGSGCLYTHPWVTSQTLAKHKTDQRSLGIKDTFSCEVLHAKETEWKLCVRS